MEMRVGHLLRQRQQLCPWLWWKGERDQGQGQGCEDSEEMERESGFLPFLRESVSVTDLSSSEHQEEI